MGQGVASSDVVQGMPVVDSVTTDAQRKAIIVKGLAAAAAGIVETNPVAAAGLAVYAVSLAEAMPEVPNSDMTAETDPVLATGIANTALRAAEAGSGATGATQTA